MMTSKKSIPITIRSKTASSALFVKRLIWLYFFLLLFEGALRKWLLPGLSGPLLLIRDPIVLLIYAVALENNFFPQNGFLTGCIVLAAVSAMVLCLQMITLALPLKVLIYGLRTDFLHLPLIFLIPVFFKGEDLVRIGKWVLWISVPMAILMAYQFRSGPDAWVNRTPGTGTGMQLESALGKIRPPGTFSFITGPVSYFALVTAFLGFALSNGRQFFPRWLVVVSTLASGGALLVSGSRSMVLTVSFVWVAFVVGIVASRQIAAGLWRIILLLLCVAFVAAQIGQKEIFKEGTEVLSARFEAGSGSEKAVGGITGRFLDSLLDPLRSLTEVPLFGSGLGLGTNVGATITQGQMGFLLSEGEWGRMILEMGPILGLAFIIYRVSLMIALGGRSLRCSRVGNLLPVLLWAACATSIVSGQIGQPTNLGFLVLIAGLTMSAIEMEPLSEVRPAEKRPRFTPRRFH
ncbi:MAG: hypothetical protein JWM99_4884 [Verrucomicrobiales bacterium]|nr:hypothetical protein [Verrucomicrobiales bacterium]